MKLNYEALTLSLLAALGLGCADPKSNGAEDSDSESGAPEPDLPPEPEPFMCANPVEIMQAETDTPSGFVQCDGGFVHRVEAIDSLAPQPGDHGSCAEFGTNCNTAADCVAQPYGACQGAGGEDLSCGCVYGCVSDADCGEGFACVPAGVLFETECVPASCLTDADCGEGLCGLSSASTICGGPFRSLACAGPFDECHHDDECGAADCPGQPGFTVDYECSASAEGFACDPPAECDGVCGRPFFVADEARTAAPCPRADWRTPTAPRPVDPATAARLAAHWAEIGLFEHASIASFARFCTELLGLGAPPSLIAQTRAALVDEIEHARLAFGLASAYAGRPIGPGPLATAGSLAGAGDLRAIVEGLVREACVEETLSAIEAGEAAGLATDPCVARILARIGEDELRHAQLGWRSLKWILAAFPQVRGFALERLAAALREAGRPAAAEPGEDLRRHGVVDPALRRRIRAHALATVLEPCAAALGRGYTAGLAPDRDELCA